MERIYLTDTQIAGRYGNHRSWSWRMLKADPNFPKPVKLSPGCTRWRLSDVEEWEAMMAAK